MSGTYWILVPAEDMDKLTSCTSSVSSVEEKKPYAWRMYHPESRKYQLFPKGDTKQSTGKQLDPEEAQAVALGQPAEDAENADKVNDLRVRIKERNLNRRRKVSVPELGPMTTVHEVAMDSPTIPGRPALHERSVSSPANSSWFLPQPYEFKPSSLSQQESAGEATSPTSKPTMSRKPSKSSLSRSKSKSKQPLSPKSLSPLTIPNQGGALPRLARQLSLSRLRSGNSHPEPSSLSVKTDESSQKGNQFSPYTPMSAPSNSNGPRSAATASTSPVPMSAPFDSRSSPRPWERSGSTTPVTTQHISPDPTATPKADLELAQRSAAATSHRRNKSESASIMDRGRPRKRSDGTPVGGGLKRAASKKNKDDEQRRAFEELPQGWKPEEAATQLDQAEANYIHKQALGQVLRFEVLKKDDVESLSKELRHLDERTEYLRRTYTSLRAGRRNLHARICQYLRSPRGAKFSQESMLKQEEALAELDASIDDWVNKLEHAENRRTRVRQKLLEHVAAAATMGMSLENTGAIDLLAQAMGGQPRHAATDISTRHEAQQRRVVARVPSVIPEVPYEDATEPGTTAEQTEEAEDPNSETELRRMESIRIYADSDVYALLADVESEFTKLRGNETPSPEPAPSSPTVPEYDDKEVHRARSHEKLQGSTKTANTPAPISTKTLDKTPPVSPPAPSPPIKDSPTGGEFFLTPAVFKPTTSASA
ncbi:hypothetical protein PG994_011103 [Apiospora phragmitis]|uniref:Up-regulated during septation protein 1 domain-containing protein n=1 Tax=Apiospora phragmitis TaxID=2905665 RepID=A0ABR1TS17_9PEZI